MKTIDIIDLIILEEYKKKRKINTKPLSKILKISENEINSRIKSYAKNGYIEGNELSLEGKIILMTLKDKLKNET